MGWASGRPVGQGPVGRRDRLRSAAARSRRRPGSAAAARPVLRRAPGPGRRGRADAWTVARRPSGSADPLGPATLQLEGDDGGAHVGHLAHDGGDLVGRAVVEQRLPTEREAPAGQQHRALGVAVEHRVGHQLDRGAGQPAVRALDDVERQAGEPEAAPLVLELAAPPSVSTSKCTARRSSGVRVRAYWMARAVARSSRSTSTTTTWRRRIGASRRLGRTSLELVLLFGVLPVQPEQGEHPEREDDRRSPTRPR